MRKGARSILLAMCLLVIAGCHHAIIDTGLTPSNQVVERPWAHSFLAGLVPPSPMDVSDQCTNGVARVETIRSFLNSVATILTYSIYAPIQITVTCAQGEEDSLAAMTFSDFVTQQRDPVPVSLGSP